MASSNRCCAGSARRLLVGCSTGRTGAAESGTRVDAGTRRPRVRATPAHHPPDTSVPGAIRIASWLLQGELSCGSASCAATGAVSRPVTVHQAAGHLAVRGRPWRSGWADDPKLSVSCSMRNGSHVRGRADLVWRGIAGSVLAAQVTIGEKSAFVDATVKHPYVGPGVGIISGSNCHRIPAVFPRHVG